MKTALITTEFISTIGESKRVLQQSNNIVFMSFLFFFFFQPESAASNSFHLSLNTFLQRPSYGGFHVIESTVKGRLLFSFCTVITP